MWIWEIKSGKVFDDTGTLIALGYSGGDKGLHPEAVNNVEFVDIHNLGPIPEGDYTICAPREDDHTGPYTLDLIPDPANVMYGRSGFRIHGDNKHLNQSASEGCIILPIGVREQIWESNDHHLRVVKQIEAIA